MKSAKLVGILSLVALVGMGLYYKLSRRAAPAGAPGQSSMSAEERRRIREFWSHYRRAGEWRLQGAWKEAIPEYRLALELDPGHEDSLYNLANCHFELAEFEDALEVLRRLVAVNPLSHRGHHQIGLVHTCPAAGSLFDLEAARAALTRAFEINKEETGSLLRLGEVALVRGDRERAMELLSLANRSNFRAVEGYYLRAYLRWKEGKAGEARQLLLEALRQSEEPVVVASVPGEGDTRPGSLLPPTTLGEKRLLEPFWNGLSERHPASSIEAEDLAAEFAPLDTRLAELRSGR